MSEAIINIQQLTVAYQGKLALNEVDVMIQPKKSLGSSVQMVRENQLL